MEEKLDAILDLLREHRQKSDDAIERIGEDCRAQGEAITKHGQCLVRLDERTKSIGERLDRMDPESLRRRSGGFGAAAGGIVAAAIAAAKELLSK